MRGPPRSPRITTACLWLVYTRAHASAIDRALPRTRRSTTSHNRNPQHQADPYDDDDDVQTDRRRTVP
jgi:hypothetical protein